VFSLVWTEFPSQLVSGMGTDEDVCANRGGIGTDEDVRANRGTGTDEDVRANQV